MYYLWFRNLYQISDARVSRDTRNFYLVSCQSVSVGDEQLKMWELEMPFEAEKKCVGPRSCP